MEHEVRKYQDREERLMLQIDRMQTLIELKSVAPATAMPQQDATACDTPTLQCATVQNVAMPQPKKRGLLGRLARAVFTDH